MRISDWSSDVCSSDLGDGTWRHLRLFLSAAHAAAGGAVQPFLLSGGAGAVDGGGRGAVLPCGAALSVARAPADAGRADPAGQPRRYLGGALRLSGGGAGALRLAVAGYASQARRRSEEHTSELQSLMRISYAVFCLKKKKHT